LNPFPPSGEDVVLSNDTSYSEDGLAQLVALQTPVQEELAIVTQELPTSTASPANQYLCTLPSLTNLDDILQLCLAELHGPIAGTSRQGVYI